MNKIKLVDNTYLDSTSIIDNELRLDKKLFHDYIYLHFINNSAWSDNAIWVPVGFGMVGSTSRGSRLIPQMPYIKIGDNVSQVRVSANLCFYNGPDDYVFMGITLNGTVQIKTICNSGRQWSPLFLECILDVKKDDLIGLSVYKDNDISVNLQDFAGFGSAKVNYLLVEVIE